MPHFTRYIGIDYSGAETADSSCRGLHASMVRRGVFGGCTNNAPEQSLVLEMYFRRLDTSTLSRPDL